eukprot:6474948-Amphidinium_carterae.1
MEKVQPSELKLTTIHIHGPDSAPVEGVLCQYGSTPVEVPHYDLEFYLTDCRVHSDYLMAKNEQQRSMQASDRFTLAVNNLEQTSMLGKIRKLSPYAVHKEAAKELQAKTEL